VGRYPREVVDGVEFVAECHYESVLYRETGLDEQDCDWIERELEAGNPWAWCSVRVVAMAGRFHGESWLGCCAYRSEDDFCGAGGYYEGMKAEALANLWANALAAGDHD
jgi:hypothetical protein